MTDIGEVAADPAWQRLLAAARRKVERTGGRLTGTIGIKSPTEAERRLIIGITGQYRSTEVASLRIALVELDDALLDQIGAGLLAVLAEFGGPVRDRKAERADEESERGRLLTDAERRCRRQAGKSWLRDWLDQLGTDGTMTRLLRRGDGVQVAWAAEVLNRLPADGIPLPALAEWTTGNTKALSGTPLAALVLRALAMRRAEAMPADGAARRALWESAGVIVDDLASQVLVLGLRAEEDHVVAGWLDDAASFGIPFRLTLHQLSSDPLTPAAGDIYVCENPAVLRAAVVAHEASEVALVCTEGQPSAACHQLLGAANGRIHWRGDFDWTGLRTTQMAIERYDAMPWRMAADDYLDALQTGDSEPLRGSPAPSPWDARLAVVLAERGRAVMEERLIPHLLSDLRGASA